MEEMESKTTVSYHVSNYRILSLIASCDGEAVRKQSLLTLYDFILLKITEDPIKDCLRKFYKT